MGNHMTVLLLLLAGFLLCGCIPHLARSLLTAFGSFLAAGMFVSLRCAPEAHRS